jgi:hypothetical protein
VAWRVRNGKTVYHDEVEYRGGQEIPLTADQARSQSMPEAVEWVEAVAEQPVAMVAEVVAEEIPVVAVKATKKRAQ